MRPASYRTGFAPRDGMPMYPGLWRGCVGAWSPGLGPSGTTLRDWSGFQRHGTLNDFTLDTAWGANQGRASLLFDGSNDDITIPNAFGTNTPTTLTFSCWIRPETATDSYSSVLVTTTASAGFWYRGSGAGANAGKVSLYYSGADHHNTTALTNSAWNHYAAVAISGAVTFYLNGKVDGTASSFPVLTALTQIGDDSASDTYKGYLDDITLWDRPLTHNEISLLALRRGIMYELAPRRRYNVQVAGGFIPSWAYYKSRIIGGGVS